MVLLLLELRITNSLCTLCAILSNEALVISKLSRYLQKAFILPKE